MQKVKEIFHKNKDDNITHGTTETPKYTSERAHTGAGAPGGAVGSGNRATSGQTGSQRGERTVGVGAGTDYGSAKEAAKEAAERDDEVAFNTNSGSAAGKPIGKEGARDAGAGTHTGDTVGQAVHPGGTGGTDGEVVDRKYVTGTEHRPQDQAVVEKYREHNPYEKEYQTTVQHTGRERQIGSQIEHLGTEERAIGGNNVQGNTHSQIHNVVPTGAQNSRPGGDGWVETKPGPVCDSTTFTVPGDRTVDKERVTNLRQHNEFEKEFEVATRLKGEHQGATPQAELLDRDHLLVDEKKKNACEGHPTV